MHSKLSNQLVKSVGFSSCMEAKIVVDFFVGTSADDNDDDHNNHGSIFFVGVIFLF